MSLTHPDASTPFGTNRRLGALFALLALEAVVTLTLFSTRSLQETDHVLLAPLRSAWLLPKFAVPALAAMILFGQERLTDEWRRLQSAERRTGPWLAAQLVCTALFWGLGVQVLNAGRTELAAPWLASAAAWLLTSTFLVVPPREVGSLLHRNIGPLAFASSVGGLAFLAGRAGTANLWEPLRVSTLHVTHGLLDLVFDEVVVRESEFIVGTERFLCRISPECSGFEGIGLLAVFLGSALWIFRHELKFPRAWLLPLVGLPLVWFANSVRIASLVWIGTFVSPRLAAEGFHSIAGLTLFCCIALGLLSLARRLTFFSRTPIASGPNWTAVYLGPFLVAMSIALIAGAFTHGLDTLYPLRPLGVAGLAFLWRDRLPRIQWRPSAIAVRYGLAGFGVWMLALYLRHGGPEPVAVQSEWSNLPWTWAALWLVFRVAGTVWMAPLTEELAFRGYLLRRLSSAEFDRQPLDRASGFAVLGSSLLFGFTHEMWLAATLCGALFAAAQLRGRSLSDAVVAHAITNGLLVVYALITGHWSVWL